MQPLWFILKTMTNTFKRHTINTWHANPVPKDKGHHRKSATRANKLSTQMFCDRISVMLDGEKPESGYVYGFFRLHCIDSGNDRILKIFCNQVPGNPKQDDEVIIFMRYSIDDSILEDVVINLDGIFDYLHPGWQPSKHLSPAERIAIGNSSRFTDERRGYYVQDLINGFLDLLGNKRFIPAGVKMFVDRDLGIHLLGNPWNHPDWDLVMIGKGHKKGVRLLLDESEEQGAFRAEAFE